MKRGLATRATVSRGNGLSTRSVERFFVGRGPTGMTAETWNLPSPPGFQGLHAEIPITHYKRNLPHWRQDGATYFVTFRLADSLPQSKLRELERLKKEFQAGRTGCQPVHQKAGETSWQPARQPGAATAWKTFRRQQMEESKQLSQIVMNKVEQWLDQGSGACWLKRKDAAQIIIDVWQHFHGERYELGCYVVMPNHVHLIVRPIIPREYPLEAILHSRKRYTSYQINNAVGRRGALWQEESFDRIIRDEEHLWRCIQYIGRNPENAGLSTIVAPRWINPSWKALGWTFEDERHGLATRATTPR